MADENIDSGTVVDNTDYIAAIKELKENSVNKEDYLKLKEENRNLLNAFVSGSGNPNGESTQEIVEIPLGDLKDHLRKEGITNLEYCTTALSIRDRILRDEGRDVFCPMGVQYVPTEEDRASAERVAAQLQEMIDIANGDPTVFNNEYQRRVQDIAPIRRK